MFYSFFDRLLINFFIGRFIWDQKITAIRVCNNGKLCASPHTSGEEEHSYGGEKEFGRAIVKSQ